MFDLDVSLLMLSLVPSGIGFVLFTYGRKMNRLPQLVGGILMMIYPYFAPTLASMIGVGVLIGAAVWWAVRLDW